MNAFSDEGGNFGIAIEGDGEGGSFVFNRYLLNVTTF